MFFVANITQKYPYFDAYIRIYKRKRAWARSLVHIFY